MGRTEKSQGLAPPAVRKDMRAKQAKQIINKTIPSLLASNSRARKGTESSELISDPALVAHGSDKPEPENSEDATYIKRKGQGRRKMKNERVVEPDPDIKLPKTTKNVPKPVSTNLSPLQRKIRILTTDTITAAHVLLPKQTRSHGPNTCILNMASPLRPGGGVLHGATSQEEFLCARTTLLPSLKENFYRLPELGGIWSPDVLVFRNHMPLGDAKGELGAGDRFWVDVISAGMLRFPELEGEEGEEKKLGKKDRGVVEAKMRAVLRIAEAKGVKKIVLGAWGCGAYGCPVVDVARAWRRVIDGTSSAGGKKEREMWHGIEEVVFAISQRKMAATFAHAFDPSIVVESGPSDGAEDEDDEGEDKEAEELRSKIQEMQGQLSKVWNADLKARMGSILDGLKAQLREREGQDGEESSTGGAQLTPEDSEVDEDEDGGDDDTDGEGAV
jgi:uncharacterized protein (TIGR02452 family)